MPRSPPVAAAVNGAATPYSTDSTTSRSGLTSSINPETNCGASRVVVAAPVKASAPNAPMTNPSRDSRVGGLNNRTTTEGRAIRIPPPTETTSPAPTKFWSTKPAAIGMPKERASTPPVKSTQPTPSTPPMAAAIASA